MNVGLPPGHKLEPASAGASEPCCVGDPLSRCGRTEKNSRSGDPSTEWLVSGRGLYLQCLGRLDASGQMFRSDIRRADSCDFFTTEVACAGCKVLKYTRS